MVPTDASPVTQREAEGEAERTAADLEGQHVRMPSDSVATYGATVPMTDNKLPLHASRSKVLLHVCIGIYATFFAINFLADLAYLVTIDARFPPGLGHLYPSEWERQQSISYTRQAMLCAISHSTLVCCAVMCIIYFGLFAKTDTILRQAASYLAEKWEYGCGRFCNVCCSPVGKLCACCCAPFKCCLSCLCSPCLRLTAQHNWRELIHGSVYLAVFGTCFLLLKAPFAYWMLTIELDFGFANALTVTKSDFIDKLVWKIASGFFFTIPGTFFYLALLQFRHGWLCMWAVMTVVLVYVQFNMASLSPLMMQMDNVFPRDIFAVGRGFPLASTTHKASPWVSLNRIYFKDFNTSSPQFSTHDKSKGDLMLGLNTTSKSWVITDSGKGPVSPNEYAQAPAAAHGSNHAMLESLDKIHWNGLGETGHVGMRSGEELMAKLSGFAQQQNINISQVYLIDGSHKDARANAFVGGMQNSIIGLYDTLFLGDHAKDSEEDEPTALLKLESGESAIQSFSEQVQGLDVGDDNADGLWSSVPTQSMTDDEIVAILAHEIAHPALGHMQQTMWLQASTSFMTFAVLGWAAHSPALAAAFSLLTPVLHVGVSVYNHILGPSLDRTMKLFSDGLIRHNEYQADAYVARLSKKYGVALQTALAKQSVNSNQDPDPPIWYEALHSDHPTLAHRWAAIESELRQRGK